MAVCLARRLVSKGMDSQCDCRPGVGSKISLAVSFANTAAVNFELHFFSVSVVVFFVYVPRSGITESLISFIFNFPLLCSA